MQSLKDSAVLATLILLALTVRIGDGDGPSIDLVGPAQAAETSAPTADVPTPQAVPERVSHETTLTAETVLQPIELSRIAFTLPDIAPLLHRIDSRIVLDNDEERVMIFIGGPSPDRPAGPAAPTTKKSCNLLRARLSS